MPRKTRGTDLRKTGLRFSLSPGERAGVRASVGATVFPRPFGAHGAVSGVLKFRAPPAVAGYSRAHRRFRGRADALAVTSGGRFYIRPVPALAESRLHGPGFGRHALTIHTVPQTRKRPSV